MIIFDSGLLFGPPYIYSCIPASLTQSARARNTGTTICLQLQPIYSTKQLASPSSQLWKS